MCGIAGFFGQVQSPKKCLTMMANTIIHRGPDFQNIWFDKNLGIGLAHTRLAILDLSQAGNQPMQSENSKFTIVFNGEIYNHQELRKELELLGNKNWKSRSDTETLLVSFEEWGIETTLKKTKGMFAIAIWDNHNRTLSLARDRIGEKPLYYGWVNHQFVFASELKAMKKFPGFCNQINREALALFLQFNSIPAPHSIYENIFKLNPGCIVTLNGHTGLLSESVYWSTLEVYKEGKNNVFNGSPQEAVNTLETILLESISLQSQADVPLGVFLSGGVDSSVIAALMQSQSSRKINSFSIGFEDKKFNEAEYARAVSGHLKTDHYDMYVTENDALSVIEHLPQIYDEPFADSSQIPTYLVSKIAKQKVSVALAGDGGDELFGGYNRYNVTANWWSKISKLPLPLRNLLSYSIELISPNIWNTTLKFLLNNDAPEGNIGDKLHKGARVLTANSIEELYTRLTSNIDIKDNWLVKNNYLTENIIKSSDFKDINSIEIMMIRDLIGYLPTDILTKVDRAAMALSLETREPFLDPNVLKFSASLPLNFKIRNGVSKWVLREVLYRYVPKELIERPKMGFGIPLAAWLRGPLREWAENLLDRKRLKEEGFFNEPLVTKKWQEHLSKKRNWHSQLWNVLMFQAWLEKNKI
ncbi:asparagine synthase (glutamine-hydrolyzing) [Alphaproteobacteria bacterium]|nr:asparagine synthase (glutamine-hydrolyzing) [Alphaproteobacteria bacterium]